jgi:hypothetical protein
MATFWKRANGRVGFRRRDVATEPVPADATEVLTFDEEANAALADAIEADTLAYSLSGGVLSRGGQAQTIAPETDARGFVSNLEAMIADLDAIIAGVDASSNAQLRDAVKRLARYQKRTMRRLARII